MRNTTDIVADKNNLHISVTSGAVIHEWMSEENPERLDAYISLFLVRTYPDGQSKSFIDYISPEEAEAVAIVLIQRAQAAREQAAALAAEQEEKVVA